jgi:hypothetical protein
MAERNLRALVLELARCTYRDNRVQPFTRVRRDASLRVGVQRLVVSYRHGVGLPGGPLCYGALTMSFET